MCNILWWAPLLHFIVFQRQRCCCGDLYLVANNSNKKITVLILFSPWITSLLTLLYYNNKTVTPSKNAETLLTDWLTDWGELWNDYDDEGDALMLHVRFTNCERSKKGEVSLKLSESIIMLAWHGKPAWLCLGEDEKRRNARKCVCMHGYIIWIPIMIINIIVIIKN